MNLMQKLLGLKPKLTARDLCIQIGCASVQVLCGRVQSSVVTQQALLHDDIIHIMMWSFLASMYVPRDNVSEGAGACGWRQQHCVRLRCTNSASWHS
jgi:hypothetical protein